MSKDVSIKFPELPLGKVDVEFSVKDDKSGVFGDLKVSKGGIEWRPKNKKNKGGNTIKKNWGQLARLLEETQ